MHEYGENCQEHKGLGFTFTFSVTDFINYPCA